MMLTVQRPVGLGCCVTINAAFLQEIKESNSQIWESLAQLRAVSRFPCSTDAEVNQWVQRLTEFRRQLSMEFALEETYGYISNAVQQHIFMGVDPVETLRQHKDLYVFLIDVCEQAEQSQYVGTALRDFENLVCAFQEFDAVLSKHEAIEAEMIRCGLGLRKSLV